MRTEVLQGFIEIVHENSIRKAAQKLGVPQQTLNKNITSLETELGVRVLERSNQGVQLTDAGTEVYQFAKWCLQEYLAVRDECMECLGVDSEVSKQHVTLGCVNTAIQNIVSQAIAELYRVKYPFELSVVQDGAFDIIEKIKKDDYQIGITLQYQSATNHYPEFEDTLQFIPIYESKPYVWVSKKNVLANLNRMD